MKENFTIPLVFGFSLLILLLLAAPAAANDTVVQALPKGRINWSAGTAVASGISIPLNTADGQPSGLPAAVFDAARRTAQANLLETVGAIRINAVSRVADRMIQDSAFRTGLIALIQNAQITRQEYLSDGTVEIELTMKLSGGFGQFVLPEEIRQVDSITATAAVEEVPATLSGGAGSEPQTGLILDAAGIGARPSLVPVVVDESGEAVYGPAFVSREFAVSHGMSGFAGTLAAARNDKRVGDRPMVVKAIRTHLTGETNLVISNADAARLRSSVVNLNFLKVCRVSIILDSEPGCGIGVPSDSKLE